MDDAGMSVSALAKAMKLSYQAVKKVLDGRSNAFTAVNNDAAARILGVSSGWLAAGRGPKRQLDGAAPQAAEQPTTYNATNLSDRALSLATRFDGLRKESHAQTIYATMSALLDGFEAEQREEERQAKPARKAPAPATHAATRRASPVR